MGAVFRFGRVMTALVALVGAADVVTRGLPIDAISFRAWEALIYYRPPDAPFEPLHRYDRRSWGDLSNLGNLHPDKAIRNAAEPCLQKTTAFNTDLFQSEKLYARVRDIQPDGAAEAKLKKNLTEGFEDSGVALPPEKRARAKEIATRLEQLRQAFERAVRDDATTVRFTPAELAGVPKSFLESRKPEADGSYVLKPDPPTYDAVMRNAKSEDTRKRMFVARVRRGGEGNIAILDEAYKLRQELAALHGQPSYAHLIQRRRMVGSPGFGLATGS